MSGSDAVTTEGQSAGDGAPAPGSTTTEGAEGADPGKMFTQAELDRIVSDRLSRERKQVVEKYGDLDQMKADSAELAKIRDGEKTDMQRLQEEFAAEKSARETAQTELAAVKRTQYGMNKGLPRDLAELLTAADDEGLDEQINKLLPHVAAAKPPKITNGDLRSGVTGSGGGTTDPKARVADAIRDLFDR